MKQMLRMAAVCIGLLLVIALPVSAAEYGAPELTPKTTMKQLRETPSIKGSGLYTYVYIWERDCDLLRHSKDNDTMEQVIGTESVNSCVAGMNYLIETYNAGTQITYKLFSPEEIAQDASRDRAELYYFPAEQPGAKYAVVLSGNALFYSGEMRGGVSTAWELHQQGYAVFALRYRIGLDATDNAPLEDLGRAIQFITANAQQFGVQTEDYALVGYSSGGQIAGIFGGKELGYPNYGVPKPGALLLAYPINNFYETKPLYHVLLDTDALERRYYDYNISDCVDADYPPTYFWYGQDDILLIAFNYWQQGPALRKALETYGVPYKESVYRHAPHGVGIGEGTDAEGWVQEATAFWEEQCA